MITLLPNKINDFAVNAIYTKMLTDIHGSKIVIKCGGVERYCEQNPGGSAITCAKCCVNTSQLCSMPGVSASCFSDFTVNYPISCADENRYERHLKQLRRERSLFFRQINDAIKNRRLNRISNEDVEKALLISCIGVFAQRFKISDVDLFPPLMKANLKRLFYSTVRSFKRFEAYFENSGCKNVEAFCFNGRFSFSLAWFLAAYRNNVEVNAVELFGRKSIYISNGYIAHDPKQLFKKFLSAHEITTTKDRMNIANRYYDIRFGWAESIGEPNFLINQNHAVSSFQSIGDVQKVAIFPSSDHEYNFLPIGYEPVNQVDEIQRFCEHLVQNNLKNVEIIVRLHPNMDGCIPDPLTQLRRLSKYFGGPDGLSLHVVGPTDPMSTVRVMNEADVVLSFASFTAVEASHLGKPVIQIGDSRYRFFNVAYLASSGQRAAEMLSTVVERGPLKNAKLGSEIWAVGFESDFDQVKNFDKPIPLTLGKKNLQSFSLMLSTTKVLGLILLLQTKRFLELKR